MFPNLDYTLELPVELSKQNKKNKQTLNQSPGTTFSSSKINPWVRDPDLDLIFKLKIPRDIQGWEPMKQIIFTFSSCSNILSYWLSKKLDKRHILIFTVLWGF